VELAVEDGNALALSGNLGLDFRQPGDVLLEFGYCGSQPGLVPKGV
jgi:hypothetical protein